MLCVNSYYAMKTCISDNIFRNCITGIKKLNAATRVDPYPDEMIKCSTTCNPISPDPFFAQQYAKVYQACQSTGQAPAVA